MENLSKAKKEFNEKLGKLQKDSEPRFYETNLKDVVIYEKLMDIQEQLEKVNDKMNNK
ncbi:MAG: hypothetical protein J0M18_04800 [Ignavibacteria bacterium]|jgi:hypothetical protein|nr:hypothetical protein [Ignavibacteria bacterium]